LAFEFGRFIEYSKSRLVGYDGFPLVSGIEGISHLDCATAFATICRWDHRYVAKLTEQILPILRISLNKGYISPSIGTSLLPVNIYYWKTYVKYIKNLLRKCDECDSTNKSNYVENIINDVQINCSPAEKYETINAIYEEIKDGKYVRNDIVVDLEKYIQFIRKNDINKGYEERENSFLVKQEYKEEERLKLGEIDITSSSILNNELKKISQEVGGYLVDDFLILVKNNCTPENYELHLNAFINLNPDLLNFYSFEKALKERLEEWSYYPLVKQWKKQNFKIVLKLWFSHFIFNENIDYERIIKLADTFSIDYSELSEIIISIIPERIIGISAAALYQTITFLCKRLNSDENEKLISWVLPKWNTAIKDEFADGNWDKNQIQPSTPNEVIALTIRYVLGHPDKRIRWRGVHALRRLVNSGNVKILGILLNQQNNQFCHPFQQRDFTFFWISSKLYLWIVIARLSKENPKEIVKFKDEILLELQNKELPHVLILYFIKATCLNLNSNDKLFFSKEEQCLIFNLLVSPFKPINEDRFKRRELKYSLRGERRFEFDTLDTLPYWYQHLGDLFNLSAYDVANLADKYISETWGYVGDIHKDDHVKTDSERDYSLTRNDHGSQPIIENLRMYYEFHAMFCAANDLLINEPLLGTNSSTNRSWENWLKSYGLKQNDIWQSDLRDPIPIDEKFWSLGFNKFDENWRDNIEDQLYDDAIGLSKELKSKSIIPFGNYTRYLNENYESVSINSAIVSIKTAEALLRAFQTSKDNHDYRIPLEDDELQIWESNFVMIGWLKEIRSEIEGIDKLDPFANDVGKYFIQFGKEVTDLFELEYRKYFKEAWYNGKLISKFENWSDINENERYDFLTSEGSIFKINTIFLLEFLKKRNMCMILECEISRQLKERDYHFTKTERKNRAKIYLIYPNGKIKTIRGRSYKIG